MEYSMHFTYKVNNAVKTATADNEDFDFEIIDDKNHLKIVLFPKHPVEILNFSAKQPYKFESDTRFFANGYQSWTDSREFTAYERMPGSGLISRFAKALTYVGDYNFVQEEKKAGEFHAISFCYARNGGTLDFFGSLNDRTGFTILYADYHNNTIAFSKDLEGKMIDSPYDILDLFMTSGAYDAVFDSYFDELKIKPITKDKIKGYTSWYNYYQNISENVILRDLVSLKEQGDLVNTFQVDDGYQTAVGDWLSIDRKKFPNGMKVIADNIHNSGFQAGLWLAPFGAQKSSELVKEHPEWLIKNEKGKPICVGLNWGGFYALDIYNDEVRAYIKNVFNEVLNVWGFDLVKLDFLYCTSIVPIHNKTRGEIAYDTMDFIRECVGDKKILGCGVQQMPCFGKVEYMRIGPDMALDWEHSFIRKNMHREDVSTPNAVHNTIYRRCLNGRAFLCDPDVFLLRRTNIKFTREQQFLLAKFIKLFGGVLFMSDNIKEYDDRQMTVLKDVLADDDSKVVAINEQNDKVFIDYIQNGKAGVLKFCVTDGTIY